MSLGRVAPSLLAAVPATLLLGLVASGCGGGAVPPATADNPSDPSEIDLPPAPVVKAEPDRPRPPRPLVDDAAKQALADARQAFERGELDAAESAFRALTSASPETYPAYLGLATVLERRGQTEEAVAAYKRALQIVPGYEEAIAGLTKLYLRTNRASTADAFLNTLRGQQPNSAAVLAALADVKSVQQDSQEAQRLAQAALKLEPDYRPAMVALAHDHYRNRRLDLALYALTAILDGYGPENPPRDKDNAEALLLRALILKEQGNRRDAIRDLKQVVQLRPDVVEARLNLAAFLLEAGNAIAAVPLLEGALAYEPANPLIHLNLGDAYRLQGRPKDALTQLVWVTQAAPKLPAPYYNIGLVYMFSKMPDVEPMVGIEKAIGAFERYQKMQPRSRPGAGDDVDELLQRARHKLTIMKAMNTEADDGFE